MSQGQFEMQLGDELNVVAKSWRRDEVRVQATPDRWDVGE
jgi:hypothetical protein